MISVIVPVYNRVKEIKLLFNSFINEYKLNPVFEIIVVDDKSDDGTFQFLQEMESNFDFVKLIISGYRSPGYSRNLAAEKASFDWLLFCDSDNLMIEGWTNQIIPLLSNNKMLDGLWFPSCSNKVVLTSNLYTRKGDHLISPFFYFNHKIGEVVHCIKKEFLVNTKYFYVSGYSNDFPDLLWAQLFLNPNRKVLFVNSVIQNYYTDSSNRISTEVSILKIESQVIHYYLVMKQLVTSRYFFSIYSLIVFSKIILFASMLERQSLNKIRFYIKPLDFVFAGNAFLGMNNFFYKLFLIYRARL